MNPDRILPRWQNTEQLPITFLYGGKPLRGVPSGWEPQVQTRRVDANITETVITGTSPQGLHLQVECRVYQDLPAAEYTAYLTNLAATDSPLVENIRMEAEFPGCGGQLYHGNGDTKKTDGYEWQTDPITRTPLTVEPCGDGTSCNGAFPYMRLIFPDRGVNLAFGWSGTWTADFTQRDRGVLLSMGQKRCRMVLHPGETMRVPSLTLVAYEGDEDSGRNTWRRWYFAHILPKPGGKLLEPKCCMHLFQAQGKPEFTGATEENQLAAIDGHLAAGIHPDVWWIDAGWYPCDFNWVRTGNWYPNPDHFPRGLKPISDRCHREGMEFLLWFEPERVHDGTDFALAHPQWTIRSTVSNQQTPNLLVDLSIPECRRFVTDMLDGYIKAFGIDIYRQDFNLRTDRGSPAECWRSVEAGDRIGAVENLHIQGYYQMWDELLERNPGLLIDSCASGGRRNDIETMRRSVPLHYTDVGYGLHPIKLKQHRQMFEWIPYFRAHNHNWCDEDGSYDGKPREPDRYSFYVAMAPALTDITEYDAPEEALALAREMQALWKKAARRMIGTDYYPLTVCRKSSQDFYAAQFHDPARQEGLVHLVNGTTATQTAFTVKLKGLDPEIRYVLTSHEQKRSWTCTGAQLMAGFSVTMEKRTGDIWLYDRA